MILMDISWIYVKCFLFLVDFVKASLPLLWSLWSWIPDVRNRSRLLRGGGSGPGGVPAPGGLVPGGACSQRGACSQGGWCLLPGEVSQHALRQTPPRGQTDRCKNITFATSLRTVIIFQCKSMDGTTVYKSLYCSLKPWKLNLWIRY